MTEEIEYPEPDDLLFWWSCYRKVPYGARVEAESVNSEFEGSEIEAYLCEYGDHWHNGKARTGENAPSKSHGPSQLRKQWRRIRNTPSIDDLLAARKAGTGRQV